jgi:hypothetical protein
LDAAGHSCLPALVHLRLGNAVALGLRHAQLDMLWKTNTPE